MRLHRNGTSSTVRRGARWARFLRATMPLLPLFLVVGCPYPLPVGSWSGPVAHGSVAGWTGSVSSTLPPDPVTVPAGQFQNVLQLETNFTTIFTGTGIEQPSGDPAGAEADAFVRGNRHIYLAAGVGIVRIEYMHESGATTVIELESSTVQPSNSYFPLAVGNEWTYSWEHIP